MSQSPAESEPPSRAYAEGWSALEHMLENGGTFSGHEPHCCFLNTGSGPFADVSAVSGLDFIDDGRAVAVADWDGDGNLDLWFGNRTAPRIRFMHNRSTGNNFVALQLKSRRQNRDAIGARVELVLRNSQRKHVQTLHAGDAYLSQSSQWVHFGLGSATEVDHVTVRWPAGTTERFGNVSANRHFSVVEGAGRAERIHRARRSIPPHPAEEPPAPETNTAARLALVQPAETPELPWINCDGETISLKRRQRGPYLVSLWATWCGPCVAELKELKRRSDEIRAMGLEVVAINVNGLVGDDPSDAAAATMFLDQIGFPFPSGFANPELLEKLNMLLKAATTGRFNSIRGGGGSMPLPLSFLLDRSDRIVAIYKGGVPLDTVLADVAGIDHRDARRRAALPFPGLLIQPPTVIPFMIRVAFGLVPQYPDEAEALLAIAGEHQREEDPARTSETIAFVYNDLGSHYVRWEKPEEAVRVYRMALQAAPDSKEAHLNLARLYTSLSRLDQQAMRHCRAALRIDPEFAEAHYCLGIVLARRARLSEAATHFAEALRLNPRHEAARAQLARVQKELKGS